MEIFKLGPKEQKVIFVLGGLLLIGLLLLFFRNGGGTFNFKSEDYAFTVITEGDGLPPVAAAKDAETVVEEIKLIEVHVTGAVASPGVYSLEEGSRAYQAVTKAGGSLEEADLEHINLAQPLYDGQQIFVPRKQEANQATGGGDASAGNATSSGGRININAATQSQLETLPGIGSVKAGQIVKYRQENGYFTSVDDLLNISGIGAKTLDNIKDLISIY